MANPIGGNLEGRGLAKSFGALWAVDHIDVVFPNQKITLLIGPNGSGKTTLLNVLSGVYKPDAGQVLYGGEDISNWEPHERTKYIARTFQIPQPFPRLTLLENLVVGAQGNPGEHIFRSFLNRGWLRNEKAATERAFQILNLLALDHLWDKTAAELSGGQLKLLELARVLMTGAKTILLDEPVGSINPTLAHTIFGHLHDMRDQLGLTMVIVEHRLDLAVQYADYAYCMGDGKIWCHGEPTKVVQDPKVIELYTGE